MTSDQKTCMWLGFFGIALFIVGFTYWDSETTKIDREIKQNREASAYKPLKLTYEPTPIVYAKTDRVAKDEFDQVRPGMTLSEVNRIIGFKGELMAESRLMGRHELFSWANDDGSNMNVQFMDGKSHTKAQFGLR